MPDPDRDDHRHHHDHGGVTLDVKRHLDEADLIAVQGLVEAATAHDGRSALGEHQWLDLVQGGRAGFTGVLGWPEGHDHPVAYAQVTRSQTRADDWALELVVAPHHREDLTTAGDLVRAGLDVVRSEGGGHLHFWVTQPQPWHERVAAANGLRRGRELYQLHRSLPAALTYELDWRPFEPGRDEEAWLEVNNAAFAWHPEQGGWTAEVLAERKELAWFDPAGFLLHEGVDENGRVRLDGFCWTKIHGHGLHPGDPPVGEIYVIAVAPWAQGQGLGRRLTLAGLDSLHRRGIGEAMLYVDATNRVGLKLYIGLDFRLDHLDRAYVGDL